MKRLLLLILVLVSLASWGQTTTQVLTGPTTKALVKGGLQVDSALTIPNDTIMRANWPKTLPAIADKNGKFYLWSPSAQKWMESGADSSVYATRYWTGTQYAPLSGYNKTNWDAAYSWGNHAGLYRPISYVPDWSEILSKPTEFAPNNASTYYIKNQTTASQSGGFAVSGNAYVGHNLDPAIQYGGIKLFNTGTIRLWIPSSTGTSELAIMDYQSSDWNSSVFSFGYNRGTNERYIKRIMRLYGEGGSGISFYPNNAGRDVFKVRAEGGVWIDNMSTAPTSPSNGVIYYNMTTHKVQTYVNGAWQNVAMENSGSFVQVQSSTMQNAAFQITGNVAIGSDQNGFGGHLAGYKMVISNGQGGSDQDILRLFTTNSGQADNTIGPILSLGGRVSGNSASDFARIKAVAPDGLYQGELQFYTNKSFTTFSAMTLAMKLTSSQTLVLPSLASGSTAPTTTGTTKMVVTDANGQLSFKDEPSSSGEANTASNLGSGTGIFAQKSGVDLQFKSLVVGTNITLSNDANTVTVSAPGDLTTFTPRYSSGSGQGDVNITIPVGQLYIELGEITASNNLTVGLSTSSTSGAQTLHHVISNISTNATYSWQYSATVKKADGTTVTTIPNGKSHTLFYNGTYWMLTSEF